MTELSQSVFFALLEVGIFISNNPHYLHLFMITFDVMTLKHMHSYIDTKNV